MIHYTDATGLFGSALAIVVLGSKMLGVLRLSRARLSWLLAVVFIAALIPMGGLPLAGYLRGAIGDLSIVSLLLLLMAPGTSLRGWPLTSENITPSPLREEGDRKTLLLLTIAALTLYPMALGVGTFDPYRLGYGNPWFMGGLLVVALVAVLRQLPWVAITIALAVLAWSVGWYESTNLWDYLLDPLVAIYAVATLFKRGVRRLRAG